MENVSPASSTSGKAGNGRTCLLSGASGYIGSRLKAKLLAEGFRVIDLSRRTDRPDKAITFQLGDAVSPEKLRGYFGLIHCAYDFGAVSRNDIWATNVRGSELLLHSAKEAGVERLVYISSISAFEGCPSLYGQAKLEVEGIARSLGAWIIRPGLVYGDDPGAAFGTLVKNVRRSKVLPIPGSGKQHLHLVHEDDLAEVVVRCVGGNWTAGGMPVTVAHEQPWPFGSILEEIAKSLGREITLVPIPWRLMWAGLRSAEALGIPLEVRSDSLVSLVRQNPRPLLNTYECLGVKCRPFEPVLAAACPN